VQADLVLSKADDATGTIIFKVDEQETRLNPAASGQGVRVLWPSLRPAPQLRVVVLNKQGAEAASQSFEGAWGLFRLMDAMKVEGGTPDRLLVSLNIGAAKMQFEMRSASVRNPLRLPELAQFRCPG
jgi:type VI secretion system protein ImpL